MAKPRAGQPLSERETRVLWMIAQGNTCKMVARMVTPRVTENTIKATSHHILVKLGASTITHAVFIALTQGLIGTHADCGDRAAYMRHRRRGETACAKCLIGKAAWDRDWRARSVQHRQECGQGPSQRAA
jgi:DNA-binding CsgD family transcriptional regulator